MEFGLTEKVELILDLRQVFKLISTLCLGLPYQSQSYVF